MTKSDTVTMDELRVGLYVMLDLNWFEHPFAFSQFKIKSEDQIRAIRELGLATVRYNVALSDAPTAPQSSQPAFEIPNGKTTGTSGSAADASGSAVDTYSQSVLPVLQAKRALVQRIREQREAAERVENAFVSSAKAIRDIEKDIFSRPKETVAQATQLVTQITDSILSAPELAIHVMGDRTGGEELYFHSLNVTMLSLMIAREVRLPDAVVGPLGMGALFHDIGRKEIPDRILLKTDPLSQAERNLYELHCQYGFEIGQKLQFPPSVLAIIRDHHELYDGSGYPRKLQGEQIGALARIVAVANYYDEMCNPPNMASAMTPHEALSIMFARLRDKFDPRVLQAFIRCLGVYPPGTIVQLSNGAMAMVATVNTAKPMKPVIIIYDVNIPKEEAILVDLAQEQDLNIAKAIRPAHVPAEIYNYLSPRKRVSYYFDAATAGQQAGVQ